jgi:hypothetical protein
VFITRRSEWVTAKRKHPQLLCPGTKWQLVGNLLEE